MGLLNFITRTFIDVFGITHPSEKEQRKAALFIGSLLGLIVAGVLAFVATLYWHSR